MEVRSWTAAHLRDEVISHVEIRVVEGRARGVHEYGRCVHDHIRGDLVVKRRAAAIGIFATCNCATDGPEVVQTSCTLREMRSSIA